MPSKSLVFAMTAVLSSFLTTAQDSRPPLRAGLSRLWSEGRYEELLRRVEPHLAESKGAADLWIMAAEAAIKLEDHERAIRLFERGLALDPALERARINLGFAYLKVDRTDDARALFEAFAKDPDKPRAAKARYGLGLVLLSTGRPKEAREALVTASRLDPDDARPHYRIGQLDLQAGDYDAAARAFATALRHDELHHGAAFGLARAHALAGRTAEAAAWTRRHRAILEAQDAVAGMVRRLEESPDPVAARVAIGRRLQSAGANRNAAGWFRRALAIDPANAEAHEALRTVIDAAETRP